VREFEAFVPGAHPLALAVEPGDPPAIVLGAQLLDRGPAAVRFAAGYAMRLCETHFDLLLEHGPMEAAATLAAIIRHFLPEFRPPFIDPAALVAAEARVARPLAKTARGELAPFASEIAGAFSPEGLHLDAEETGARAGLLACGDVAAALDVIALRVLGFPAPSLFAAMQIPVAARLVEFALSDDHEELVAALDAVS
jgi:hypothetical protein